MSGFKILRVETVYYNAGRHNLYFNIYKRVKRSSTNPVPLAGNILVNHEKMAAQKHRINGFVRGENVLSTYIFFYLLIKQIILDSNFSC